VQDQFRDRVGRRDRGVKQAGYYVISFTSMPSALIELGFLTNKKEEDYLHSKQGKDYMASAIFRAIRDYKTQMSGGTASSPTQNVIVDDKKTEAVREKESETDENLTASLEQIGKDSGETGKAVMDTMANHGVVDTSDAASLISSSMNNSSIASGNLVFAIQFKTSSKPLAIVPENFNGLTEVDEYISNGLYKYVAMATNDFDQAKINQDNVRAKGYSDAFMVAFEDGERISMKKALKSIK